MPANKSQTQRLHVLDDILADKQLAPEKKTAKALLKAVQDRLGVQLSSSMFHKDIAFMRTEYGAPIEFDRAKGCYTYSDPDFSIKGLSLNHEEKRALSMAPAFLEKLKGTPLYEHFRKAIGKVIQGYRISELLGKTERQIIQVEEPVALLGDQWVEPLLHAILEGYKALKILYAPFEREPRSHYFSPYFIREYRHRWYVIGHSDTVNDILVLSLDRIRSLEISNKPFAGNPDFNPDDYYRHSIGITNFNGSPPEKVEIRFTRSQANYVESQPWHHSQRLVRESTRYKVFAYELHITHELIMAILACGAAARVLKPRGLVERVSGEITSMRNQY